jgi:hypothetical protein
MVQSVRAGDFASNNSVQTPKRQVKRFSRDHLEFGKGDGKEAIVTAISKTKKIAKDTLAGFKSKHET